MTNRWELVLGMVLHTIQQTWFHRLNYTGMKLIPIRFVLNGKALSIFIIALSQLWPFWQFISVHNGPWTNLLTFIWYRFWHKLVSLAGDVIDVDACTCAKSLWGLFFSRPRNLIGRRASDSVATLGRPRTSLGSRPTAPTCCLPARTKPPACTHRGRDRKLVGTKTKQAPGTRWAVRRCTATTWAAWRPWRRLALFLERKKR